jgi:hypothetical protein
MKKSENIKCPIEGCKNNATYSRKLDMYLCSSHKAYYWKHGTLPERAKTASNKIEVKEDTFEIILTDRFSNEKGRATVDLEDLEKVRNYKWYLTSHGYCAHRSAENGIIYLHRLILGLNKEEEEIIDHIDNNKLNNKKVNLRKCSYEENAMNRYSRKEKPSSSGFRGVYWFEKDEVWTATIVIKSKEIRIGSFKTKEEAIAARRGAEIVLYKTFAPLEIEK